MDAEKRKYAHEIGTINTLCATTAFLSEKISVLEEVNATSRNIIDKVGAGKIIYKKINVKICILWLTFPLVHCKVSTKAIKKGEVQ